MMCALLFFSALYEEMTGKLENFNVYINILSLEILLIYWPTVCDGKFNPVLMFDVFMAVVLYEMSFANFIFINHGYLAAVFMLVW
jgi:hypothetical protein